MEIRLQLADGFEIEFVKAPFGQSHPLGLLIEGQGQSILFDDINLVAVAEFFGTPKADYSHNDCTLSWDDGHAVINGDLRIAVSEQEASQIAFYAFLRAIDPY